VVDYGCGDALHADRVAEACAHLFLCESAASVRERLRARYAGAGNISILTPEQFEQLDPLTIDAIVVNSVVQYLSEAQFTRLLAVWRSKLRPAGRLVLADIVPRNVSPYRDAMELVKFAAANGFLFAALKGLARSYFSGYRKIREGLGFLQLDEAEVLGMLEQAGLAGNRHYPNIGHNARRMTFVATVAGPDAGAARA
jgi:SAM-dependent methyltransferase